MEGGDYMKGNQHWIGLLLALSVMLGGSYIWLTNTSKNEEGKVLFLLEAPIAHRGLHDNDHPENSLGAFEQAIEQNYLIELDVQLSKDNIPIVFHDTNLKRMTGVEGVVGDYTAAQLQQLCLANTTEQIPTLQEVLLLVKNQTGILLEIKDAPQIEPVCQQVALAIEEYKGAIAIQSFNPFVIEWFKNNQPHLPRGIISGNFSKDAESLAEYEKFALKHLMLNFKAKPQFINYELEGMPNEAVARLRKKGIPILVWTIKNNVDYHKAMQYGDNVVFDQ